MRVPVYYMHNFKGTDAVFYEKRFLDIPLQNMIEMGITDKDSMFILSQIKRKDNNLFEKLETICSIKFMVKGSINRIVSGFIVYPSTKDLKNLLSNYVEPITNLNLKTIIKQIDTPPSNTRDFYGFKEIAAITLNTFTSIRDIFHPLPYKEGYTFVRCPDVTFSVFRSPAQKLKLSDTEITISYYFLIVDHQKHYVLFWDGNKFHTSLENVDAHILEQFGREALSYPYPALNLTPFYKMVACIVLSKIHPYDFANFKPIHPLPPPFDKKSFIIIDPETHIFKFSEECVVIDNQNDVKMILTKIQPSMVYIHNVEPSKNINPDLFSKKLYAAVEISL